MNEHDILQDSFQEAPVVRLVETILHDAISQGVSDIHIEPGKLSIRIRFRIDGILHDQQIVDVQLTTRLIARIKIVAHIDISEKRVPQDGKFHMIVDGREIDVRVSTFPALFGEKIVLRILDRNAQMIHLDTLGFFEDMEFVFKDLLSKAQGFLLVCGPTGSGKTTTLYAALSELHDPAKHIITLEDPVEYNVSGVTQGQINPDSGFTFQVGMRALLRQDPDVVMVGEMRDAQTAQIAHEAALTGHMVLSTIHTNDAPSVIMRLMDMGIEPFLINASLTGVLAQRLARKICLACRVRVEANAQEQLFLEGLGFITTELYKGQGCQECYGRGYKGRIGIFELLVMTPELRSLIVSSPNIDAITAQAKADGMQPLLQDGARKVVQGLISFQELLRVVA